MEGTEALGLRRLVHQNHNAGIKKQDADAEANRYSPVTLSLGTKVDGLALIGLA